MDLHDDLNLDDDTTLGSQIDVDWKFFDKFHLTLGFTYDRFDQRGATNRDLFKGGESNPLRAGSTIGGSADMYTMSLTFGYDVYRDKTWVVTPYVGGRMAIINEELFVVDVNRTFTLSGKGVQEVSLATPLAGFEVKAYATRHFYTGLNMAGFGLENWFYVNGRGFLGYDFNPNWGARVGVDAHYGQQENASKSLAVEGGLGNVFLQAVYGF